MLDLRLLGAAVFAFSAALLGGAFVFQYFGYAPCVLCIWQRYPHGIAMALGALAFLLAGYRRLAAGLVILAAATLLVGAGIAAFHVGVEQKWWEGTQGCGSTFAPATSIEEMRRRLLAQPIVRCDEVAWSLFGISMAGYNFLFSVAMAALAAWAVRWNWRREAQAGP